MATLIKPDNIPSEYLDKLNKVKKRILFLPPTVVTNQEREAKKEDFEALSGEPLGKGGFGKVFKVRHKTSKNVYAIKIVSKEQILKSNMVENIQLEVRIMYSLNHEHIIKLHNHFEDDRFVYLVEELATGGNLYEKLKRVGRFSERQAAQYLRELITAVDYLHSMTPPIIHRDIKPENILLDADDSTRLCDFGWSNFFHSDLTRQTFCGTPDYLPPEMITKKGHDMNLDLWNLGVLIFELLTGRAPFQGANQAELFSNILKLKINYPKDFSSVAKDLVIKLLKVNPAERLPLKAIAEHTWFKKNPELRPVLAREYKKEKPLANLTDPMEHGDFEAVSTLSKTQKKKIDRLRMMMRRFSLSDEQMKKLSPQKVKSEKDKMIQELSWKLERQNKEMADAKNEAKGIIEIQQKQIQKYELDLKDKSTAEKDEIKRLKEELEKQKSLASGKDELTRDLDKARNEVIDLAGKCKSMENEISNLKTTIQALQAKAEEQTKQLAASESTYADYKLKQEEQSIAKDKKVFTLEAKIEEMNTIIKSMQDNSAKLSSSGKTAVVSGESAETAMITQCKELLESMKTKMTSEMQFSTMVEGLRAEIVSCYKTIKEEKILREQQNFKYQNIISQAHEEVLNQCAAQKEKEMAEKDSQIKELQKRIAELESEKIISESEREKIAHGELAKAKIVKENEELKILVERYKKTVEYHSKEMKKREADMQDLEMRLAKEKQKNLSAEE